MQDLIAKISEVASLWEEYEMIRTVCFSIWFGLLSLVISLARLESQRLTGI
jgi:hypothetical protein